jgi:hypothetical protein
MERPQLLSDVLRAARHELDGRQPPPAVWAAVRDAHGHANARRAPAAPPPRRGWAWSGALACAVLLAGSTLLMWLPPAPPETSTDASSGFLPLVSPERWNGATAEPTWLVRTELPRERLAALGLPYDPARAGDSVRAELLMHESGEVLAVRFLR